MTSPPPRDPAPETTLAVLGSSPSSPTVRRFRLRVVEGPAKGNTWESTGAACSIGSHENNDLAIDDGTVSRFHCEIQVDGDGVRIRDTKSRNGTVVDGVHIVEAFLRTASRVRLGRTVLEVELSTETNRVPISENTRFGSLTGTSTAMRAAFALLERAAERDVTVLLDGETGTGKSQAARSLHDMSTRRAKPFVVVDCGALIGNLLESELFGHEKGSFTGATERRIGAFEEADGGTVFLDEVGEMPLDLQPKLLRALEAREIRRVGENKYKPVNVRVIAATNRDLRADVNAARFRADLYFRLAVVTIAMPPLRKRPEDLPALVADILKSLRATPEEANLLQTQDFLAKCTQAAWPGNVRELRNFLERCLVMRAALPMEGDVLPQPAGDFSVNADAPYADERERIILEFERRYFTQLLEKNGGNVKRTADAAGLDRRYLYRILARHHIRGSD
ncbi:MAG: sigma 54-dependent Fis family transcriptional regulator [Polyangiaceae bacterium]|nr:sigma 54-dependent Fis family transcriptional regulator [Polyangiaceae bacterium]